MIVFSGVVSDQIQRKTMKRRNKFSFCLSCIVVSAVIVLDGILFFVFVGDMIEWLILSAALIVAVLLQLFFVRVELPFRWEYNIKIDSENIVVESPIWPKPLQKPLKKIKKVLDVGDCYYIIYGDISNCIVCQKNLIQEGTIEEFETLFQGKIVRQNA